MSGFDLRLKTIGLFTGVLLIMLTGRLWVLQLTQWVDFREKSMQNRTSIVSTPAPRGLIYDREGRVLAENRPNWCVMITPAELPPESESEERERIITFLASVLRERDVSTSEVRAALEGVCSAARFTPTPLATFAEDLSFELVAQIEERSSELPGVSVGQQFRRHYPHGKLASHVVGYARSINAEQYEKWRALQYPSVGPIVEQTEGAEPWRNDPVYKPDSIFGKAGIEASYELDAAAEPTTPVLQGRRGMRVWEVDRFNRPVRLIRQERVPQQGAGVYLTIDAQLQQVAEDALKKAIGSRLTGAAVLMDVRTGEVLAMASEPSVDANEWVSGISGERYRELSEDPRHPFLNKAISGSYPPGSIFKMVSALAALEETGVSPEQSFDCEGRISVGNPPHIFKCWKTHGSRINMWQGLAESCDVYFYDLVRKSGLTSDMIAAYARLFGMGEPTNCGLPGEVGGRVPDREWKADALDQDWYTGDTLQFVMGQSFLRVTPLQMAVMTAALANDGKVISPRLVRKIEWPEYLMRGPTLFRASVVNELDVDPENLKIVQQGMRRAVTSDDGTARGLADIGFSVAGKTGSAQFEPNKRTHAWFVCYAPYEEPRFASAVLVTEGGGGSESAAPVAAAIMKAAMAKYAGGDSVSIQTLMPESANGEVLTSDEGDEHAAANETDEG
ncbi:MAG: penicillin-binding protein 2 [Armatimonadota bacterium]